MTDTPAFHLHRRALRLAGLGAAVLAAGLLLPASPAAAQPRTDRGGHGDAAAVFVQTDDLAGNTVLSYHRAANGTLSAAGSFATGGLGGQLAGSVVDHTASQGALALDRRHRMLIAVNAGSDTITVFGVHGSDLAGRQVLSSGGSFPVSVTVSGDRVYVLNALAGGAIQGFVWTGRGLLRVPGWHRELGLPADATPQFTHTPGQVAFTPDGQHLLVTTKAASNSILVYGFGPGGLPSATPTVTELPDAVPFAVDFTEGRILVALTGTNSVASFRLRPDDSLVQLSAVSTGQAATCWIAVAGEHGYASNAGSATLSGVQIGPRGSLTLLGNTPTDAGTVDAAASPDGHFLYVQTGAAGIVDAFVVHRDGSLTGSGSVTVPNAAGGEGIAVS